MSFTRWSSELRDDARFGIRELRRAPAFTLIAATTLALGIGANSAIFALVDATLLSPLPYRDPERLVMIYERNERSPKNRVAPLNALDWSARSRTFERISGYMPNVGGMVMSGADGNAETVSRQWVLSGLFDVLGVRVLAGRTFLPLDDAERVRAIVLSEPFWRTRFGADPKVVGSQLRLDGDLWTVVGVVPKEFELTGGTSIWALRSFERTPELRGARGFFAVGACGPPSRSRRRAPTCPGSPRSWRASSRRRTRAAASCSSRSTTRSSVTELRLTSMLPRRRRFRAAHLLRQRRQPAAGADGRAARAGRPLGARRRRAASIRQLLTESLRARRRRRPLGLGVGADPAGAPAVIPRALARGGDTRLRRRVVAFCARRTAGRRASAWRSVAGDAGCRRAGDRLDRPDDDGPRQRMRGLLVVGEVATAMLLLFGAGLLLRTLLAVDDVDRGYRAGAP